MLSDDTPHILVIDDDTWLRELLRKYLSDNGFWLPRPPMQLKPADAWRACISIF